LIQIRGLEVAFARHRRDSEQPSTLLAVDGVNLDIYPGETLCVVGESGSGKTTTARAIGALVAPTAGSVQIDGVGVSTLRGRRLKEFRRRVQFVFQDPFESLNPRQRVREIVAEPLIVHRLAGNKKEVAARVIESLEECGLSPGEQFAGRYPHELSGGQRQRVSIAAATILGPKLLIADEPVSMLDVSVRAGIIQLLLKLRQAHQMALMFVTHDLSLAWAIGDRVAVMYAGRLLEIGTPEQVITAPAHPYTSALVSAIPEADPDLPLRPMNLVSDSVTVASREACCFRLRCPYAKPECASERPPLKDVGSEHQSACLRYLEIRGELPKMELRPLASDKR